MKNLRVLLIAIAMFLSFLLTSVAQQDDLASAPRISLDDFKKLAKGNGTVVVDVRGLDSYKAGHIPGAVSLPLAEIPARWKELPAEKPIVTYCS
jgi:3-mercaptopyruvate sulfurtransferase SseA